MKTFKCDFGSGVTCQIEVSDVPPAAKEAHILKAEWTGKPTKAHLRPYIAWINSVNTQLAKEWNISFMHVFQLGRFWSKAEAWYYAPNKPPKKVVL